jgi:hypothetical protein
MRGLEPALFYWESTKQYPNSTFGSSQQYRFAVKVCVKQAGGLLWLALKEQIGR